MILHEMFALQDSCKWDAQYNHIISFSFVR